MVETGLDNRAHMRHHRETAIDEETKIPDSTPYNLFLDGSSGPAYGNERELRARLDLS